MRGKARSNPPAKGGGPGKDYVFSYSMRHDNENNLGADVFIDWVDNSSGYDGLVGSSSLGNRLAGTIFGGTGSAFENFTSAPQNAPPGAPCRSPGDNTKYDDNG